MTAELNSYYEELEASGMFDECKISENSEYHRIEFLCEKYHKAENEVHYFFQGTVYNGGTEDAKTSISWSKGQFISEGT
jgi:hypothetical protein